MAVMTLAAPLGLAILAVCFFYMAFKYREQERFGRFEILYTMGHLFALALLFLLYNTLNEAGDTFANVVLPLFMAFLWIYVLVCLVMVFRMIKNLIFSIMHYKGKGYVDG